MDKIIHRFEEAGLGVAPFRFDTAVYGDWSNCQYCGHEIKEKCFILDSTGKRFFVGNECVNHTDDTGLINATKKAINELRRQRRLERQESMINRARMMLYWFPHLAEAYIKAEKSYLRDANRVTTYIRNTNMYGGNSYKEKVAKAVFALAPEVLQEQELTFFDNQREFIDNDFIVREEQRKAKEKAESDARAAEWRAAQAKIAEDNADIIAVFEGLNSFSGFVSDMKSKLRYTKLEDFSPRQREVIGDIYAKSFGKSGTIEYKEALEKFNARATTT